MLLKQNSCHLDGSSCLLFLVIFLVYLTRGGSGCSAPRLVEISPGDTLDPDLLALGQELQSWNSILDCRLKKGQYGLEIELITFRGEKLPKLPSAARQIIRPWDPDHDEPFWYVPKMEKNTEFSEEGS